MLSITVPSEGITRHADAPTGTTNVRGGHRTPMRRWWVRSGKMEAADMLIEISFIAKPKAAPRTLKRTFIHMNGGAMVTEGRAARKGERAVGTGKARASTGTIRIMNSIPMSAGVPRISHVSSTVRASPPIPLCFLASRHRLEMQANVPGGGGAGRTDRRTSQRQWVTATTTPNGHPRCDQGQRRWSRIDSACCRERDRGTPIGRWWIDRAERRCNRSQWWSIVHPRTRSAVDSSLTLSLYRSPRDADARRCLFARTVGRNKGLVST